MGKLFEYPMETELPQAEEKVKRMQILLSEEAYLNLEDLRDLNESGSFGEIIRRSVQLLYRVIGQIGLPEDISTSETEVVFSRRLQAQVAYQTLKRIQDLCEEGGILESKSDVVRIALELYSKVSEAQRNMKEYVIKGPKGEMKSSLAISP